MPWMKVLDRKCLATQMSICKCPILQHLHEVPLSIRMGGAPSVMVIDRNLQRLRQVPLSIRRRRALMGTAQVFLESSVGAAGEELLQ